MSRRSAVEPAMLGRIRRMCLALPEVTEAASWGHPNFKAGKKVFVTFEWIKGRPSIAFRLNASDVELLLAKRNFYQTPYGRGQWVSAWADAPVDPRLLARLVERSYRVVAIKRMLRAIDSVSVP